MITRTITGLVLLLSSTAAHAQHNRRYRHDQGQFFMRLSGGFGFDSVSFDDDSDTKLSGVGGMGSFAFGGTVARNLAIHADLFGMSMFEPNVEQNGNDLGDADNTSARLGAIGLGLTYYFEPVNLYLAGSLGVGVGTIEASARSGGVTFRFQEDTDPGLAVNLMLGKEWWVSRRWGIGIAGQVIFASLATDDNDDVSVFGVGVLFSASYN